MKIALMLIFRAPELATSSKSIASQAKEVLALAQFTDLIGILLVYQRVTVTGSGLVFS